MLQQILQNPQMFRQKLDNFIRQQGGQDPQQIIRQLLSTGQMTQAQYNEYRNIANQLLGMRF